MPIVRILTFLLGDRRLYWTGFCRMIPIIPVLTQDGWLVWLWPVWREDSSSGGGWDSSWAWIYHRRLPEGTTKPVFPTPGLGVMDKIVLWFAGVPLAIAAWNTWGGSFCLPFGA